MCLTHPVKGLMRSNGSVVPDLPPELGRFRNTPLPQVTVAPKGEIVFLADRDHEIEHGGVLRKRWPPQDIV